MSPCFSVRLTQLGLLVSLYSRPFAAPHSRCRCTALPNTVPPLYYIASCSNSNSNAHTVTFFSDPACTTAKSTAAPPSGAMAALEYPCLRISDTSSVSAGALNEALYGIGSVILWRDSATCQGTNNVVRPQYLSLLRPSLMLPALFLSPFKVACSTFPFAFVYRHSHSAELFPQ